MLASTIQFSHNTTPTPHTPEQPFQAVTMTALLGINNVIPDTQQHAKYLLPTTYVGLFADHRVIIHPIIMC